MILYQQSIKNWKRLNLLVASRRYLCAESRREQSDKSSKYEHFRSAIERPFPWTDNRKDCLIYMKNVFDSFQQMVHVKHVSQNRLNLLWDKYLDKNEVEKIRDSLTYVNNHSNFGLLKQCLIQNFNKFDLKEILLIRAMYESLDRNLNDDKTAKILKDLDEFCVKNFQNFDLIDLSYSAYASRDDGFKKMAKDHVLKLLLNNTNGIGDNQHLLEIEPDCGIFEKEMRRFDDGNSNLWLKMKVLKYFSTKIELKDWAVFIETAFKESTENLRNMNSILYKVNFLNMLFYSSAYESKASRAIQKDSKYIQIIKQEYLHDFFRNLELVEYKLNLKTAFVFLKQNNILNSEESINYLMDNFKSKLCTNSLNQLEYFIYLHLFYDLVVGKIILTNWKDYSRLNVIIKDLKNEYPVDFMVTQNVKVKYYLMNLEDEVKMKISSSFDKSIQSADRLCLEALNDGIYTVYTVHPKPHSVLDNLHRKLFEAVTESQILKTIVPFVSTLIIGSNETTKRHEVELSRLLIQCQLHDCSLQIKRDLTPVLMMNSDTILENYAYIADLINDLLEKCDSFKMVNLFILFDKHFDTLISEDKERTLLICSAMYKKVFMEFNQNDRLNKIESLKVFKLLHSCFRKARVLYYRNMLTLDEYDGMFTKDLKIQSIDRAKFDEECPIKYLKFYRRISRLVNLYKLSRQYSEENLEVIWKYLMQCIEWNLQTFSNHTKPDFMTNIIMTMALFNSFDFTKSDRFRQDFEKFRHLNELFYKKYRHSLSMDKGRLMKYAKHLALLDCFVPAVFDDLLGGILSRSHLIERFFYPYLSIYYKAYKNHLDFQLTSIFHRPNEKFCNDFKQRYLQFFEANHHETLSYVFFVGLSKENAIVLSHYSTAITTVPIVLVDKVSCYQNDSSKLTRNVSFQIECMKELNNRLIIVREGEFYKTEFNRIFEEKIRNILK